MTDFTYHSSVSNPLTNVKEGMAVVDLAGDRVGTVRVVRFSDENPNTPEAEVATARTYEKPDSLVEDFAEALVADPADDMPETLRARLVQAGYIRIDTGLLRSDRFATADQVAGVHEDHVHLNVSIDELVKP